MTNSSPPKRPTRSRSRTSERRAVGDGGEHLITRQVAVEIVDRFEMVEVEHEHRVRHARAARPAQLVLGPRAPGVGVEEPGLPVGGGRLLELAHENGPVQHEQRRQHERHQHTG